MKTKYIMSETSLLTKSLWNLCKTHTKWRNWMENYNWGHIHPLFNEIEITEREKEKKKKKKPQTKLETDKNKSFSQMLLCIIF